ncbi:MAG: hypothetical protein PVF54_11095 [Anaerolineae bacterium]|jgi:hypothetical protein
MILKTAVEKFTNAIPQFIRRGTPADRVDTDVFAVGVSSIGVPTNTISGASHSP